MKKYIGIALAVLMILGMSTVVFADLPPYQGVLTSSTTTNWSGSGNFWGNTDYLGISQASFDTAGASCFGSYTANTYTAYELGMTLNMLGTQIRAQAFSPNASSLAYIEHSQNRLGPSPVWYGASAPGGQLSESQIYVWDGTAEVAMTTMTGGSGTLNDNNYGGIKCALGGHYQANLVADVDPTIGYYEIRRNIEASDGDYVETLAWGNGHAYLESLSTSMSPSQATVNSYYSGFHADTAGWGGFQLEGYGNNEVIKHSGFSYSQPIIITPGTVLPDGIHNYGTGAPGSAFLGVYASWSTGTSFDMSDTGMTAN